MAWKITTKTFASSASPYTFESAGQYPKIIVQAGSGSTTIQGSMDGTNKAADLNPTANTPTVMDNFPKIVFTNGSGDTVLIAERVADPS